MAQRNPVSRQRQDGREPAGYKIAPHEPIERAKAALGDDPSLTNALFECGDKTTRRSSRQGLREPGPRLLQQQGLDRAIADYGGAVKLSPKDAWAFAHWCQAYESKGDHDAAIADCTEAIRIDANYGWAYNNRGVAYYGLHEYDAALADHAEAINQNWR